VESLKSLVRQAPGSGSLVLDSQRSVTLTGAVACPVPRKVWVESLFQLVRVPCKRWSCTVCGPRKSRELARVLLLDAADDAPGFAITLTTVDPDTTAALYRRASAVLWKRLRRRYGRVEYFGFIEFTTGHGIRSGGRRRMHGHYLVKFRDAEPIPAEAERLVLETWQSLTGAYRIEVEPLRTPAGAMTYLSLHHQKPQQAPPLEWRGMRSRPSKHYFSKPVAKLRDTAREQLTVEAIAWKRGISEHEARLIVRGPADV
jgi:hypothetical protein